jgi:hypothetical protein
MHWVVLLLQALQALLEVCQTVLLNRHAKVVFLVLTITLMVDSAEAEVAGIQVGAVEVTVVDREEATLPHVVEEEVAHLMLLI